MGVCVRDRWQVKAKRSYENRRFFFPGVITLTVEADILQWEHFSFEDQKNKEWTVSRLASLASLSSGWGQCNLGAGDFMLSGGGQYVGAEIFGRACWRGRRKVDCRLSIFEKLFTQGCNSGCLIAKVDCRLLIFEKLFTHTLRVKAITTRNPQANAILERVHVHATIGNIIRTHHQAAPYGIQNWIQNWPFFDICRCDGV